MKEYYAIYIPIGGEIKPGEIYRSKWRADNKLHHYSTCSKIENDKIFPTEEVGSENVFDLTDAIKVKLFLCSLEELKINDTVITPYPTYTSNVINEDNIEYFQELVNIPNYIKTKSGYSLNSYKVLGKISKDAIWIKEFDIFNEKDIQIIYKDEYVCTCEDPNVYRSEAQSTCQYLVDDGRGGDFCVRTEKKIDIIKIKCPTCKQYH